MALDIIAVHFM